jgi:hypothetical protein
MTSSVKDPDGNLIYLDFRLRGRFPDDPRAIEKREALRRLVAESMVMVVLDPRTPGVDVPRTYLNDAELRLNVSPRFGAYFSFDRYGIWATLTFNGMPHDCIVPWAAVKRMISHETQEVVDFR